MRAWHIIALVSLVPSAAVAASDPPWLVEVRSNYLDQGTHEEVRVSGTGFIFRVKDKTYVATAAHVSQGDQTRIVRPDGTVSAIPSRRLADDLKDVEIFEIETTDSPVLAAYEGWNDLLLIPEDHAREMRGMIRQDFPNTGSYLVPAGPDSYLPVGSWVTSRGGLRRWTRESIRRSGSEGLVQSTGFGENLTLPAKIVPGMSGAPLIAVTKMQVPLKLTVNEKEQIFTYLATIQGIVTQVERGFDRSHLTHERVLMDLIDRYEKGERGHVNAARWRLRHGLTYRDLYGDGRTLEINPDRKNAGDATLVSSGNGVSADGGNGVSADGGRQSLSRKNRQIWSDAKIRPGVLWNNKPVAAFRLGSGGPVLNANLAALEYLQKNGKRQTLEPIAPTAPIASLLKEKIPEMPGVSNTRFVLRPTHMPRADVDAELEFDRGRVRIRIYMPDDTICLELDEKGALVGGDSGFFEPVVRVKGGRSGQNYHVDLRGLFFADLSLSKNDDWELLSDPGTPSPILAMRPSADRMKGGRKSRNETLERYSNSPEDEIGRQWRKIALRVTKERSSGHVADEEIEIEFFKYPTTYARTKPGQQCTPLPSEPGPVAAKLWNSLQGVLSESSLNK